MSELSERILNTENFSDLYDTEIKDLVDNYESNKNVLEDIVDRIIDITDTEDLTEFQVSNICDFLLYLPQIVQVHFMKRITRSKGAAQILLELDKESRENVSSELYYSMFDYFGYSKEDVQKSLDKLTEAIDENKKED